MNKFNLNMILNIDDFNNLSKSEMLDVINILKSSYLSQYINNNRNIEMLEKQIKLITNKLTDKENEIQEMHKYNKIYKNKLKHKLSIKERILGKIIV